MLGVDYTGQVTSPALMSGAWILPNTLVVAEARPNYVVVEGGDGTTVTATALGHIEGIGQIGEYLRYSYVLDEDTLTDIAETRLANNIQTVAASIELSAGHHLRPFVDFYVGDIIYVDLATHGLPADWYRVEAIRLAADDEGGLRYVVDVGRAVIANDAVIADKVAAILEANLVDTDTGVVGTTGDTGQTNPTIVLTTSDIPAHDHVWDDLPTRTVGGDLSGTADAATVRKLRGNAVAGGTPDDGDSLVWYDANAIAEWRTRVTVDTAANRAAAAAGDLRHGDAWIDTDDDSLHIWDGDAESWIAVTAGSGASGDSLRTVEAATVDTSGDLTYRFGANSDGVPYFNSAGVTDGDEGALLVDPSDGQFYLEEING